MLNSSLLTPTRRLQICSGRSGHTEAVQVFYDPFKVKETPESITLLHNNTNGVVFYASDFKARVLAFQPTHTRPPFPAAHTNTGRV